MIHTTIGNDEPKQSTAHYHHRLFRTTTTYHGSSLQQRPPPTASTRNNQPHFTINREGMSRTITKYPGITQTTSPNDDTKQSTSHHH
jgi:hypothetical protein